VSRQFDEERNTFKKSNSRKHKKDRIRFSGKPMKPKTKPRDHDYHLIAREKKSLEKKDHFKKKDHFEKNLWEEN